MKILLINHYAGRPELGMEFRPYYLAQEWQKKGHETRIVGGTFSHLRKKQPPAGLEVLNNISFFWLKTFKYKGNGLLRFLSMIQFTLKLIFSKKFLKNFHPDVVIASSTYTIDNFAAKHIANKYKSKYIYEIHDLWPLSPMELGNMSKHHPFVMIMQWGENFAYTHCDAVVSILPKVEEHCIAHGLDSIKLFHIPNGIVVENWNDEKQLNVNVVDTLKHIKSQFSFLIGYAGGHAISNALDELLDVAKLCRKESIAFLLIGDGIEKQRLKKRAAIEKINNVFFFNSVPKNEIPSMFSFMDAFYLGWQKQNLYRFGVSPNKIFDYMMAEKPIIQAIASGNNIVKEANCGFFADPKNVEEIKDVILKLKNLPKKEQKQLGYNGKQFVLKEHCYSVLAKRFLNIMQKLVDVD